MKSPRRFAVSYPKEWRTPQVPKKKPGISRAKTKEE
jgi:hypothetical protein